jgi:hypothetical protein
MTFKEGALIFLKISSDIPIVNGITPVYGESLLTVSSRRPER